MCPLNVSVLDVFSMYWVFFVCLVCFLSVLCVLCLCWVFFCLSWLFHICVESCVCVWFLYVCVGCFMCVLSFMSLLGVLCLCWVFYICVRCIIYVFDHHLCVHACSKHNGL